MIPTVPPPPHPPPPPSPPPPPPHPHFSLACYGRNTADAEFKVPTSEYPGLSKVFPFQPEVGQNIAAHAAPTARSLSSDFCSPRSFGFFFLLFFFLFFFFFFLFALIHLLICLTSVIRFKPLNFFFKCIPVLFRNPSAAASRQSQLLKVWSQS